MNRNSLLPVLLIAAALFYVWLQPGRSPAPQPPSPTPAPVPKKPCPPDRPCPLRDFDAIDTPRLGGLTSPDGEVRVRCDLPASEKRKNVGGRDGAGLCVFTSVEYAARWQGEERLAKFQDDMRRELGGGWPEKLDKMIAKYGKNVQYVQHTAGDMEFLKLVLRTGRMPGITYGGSDPHYRGYVAHMVNLVYLDESHAAISDNNFPGDDEIVWMSPAELGKRWKAGGGGWAVALLNPPPPPPVRK